MSFSSERSLMAVVEVTSRSTHRKDKNDWWDEYARAGTAIYVIAHRKETGGRGEEKMVLGSAQPYNGQGAGDMLQNARETAELRGVSTKREKDMSASVLVSA